MATSIEISFGSPQVTSTALWPSTDLRPSDYRAEATALPDTGTMTPATIAIGVASAAAVASGSLAAATSVDGSGVYCSDMSLSCSETLACSDSDGLLAGVVSSGSLTPA